MNLRNLAGYLDLREIHVAKAIISVHKVRYPLLPDACKSLVGAFCYRNLQEIAITCCAYFSICQNGITDCSECLCPTSLKHETKHARFLPRTSLLLATCRSLNTFLVAVPVYTFPNIVVSPITSTSSEFMAVKIAMASSAQSNVKMSDLGA